MLLLFHVDLDHVTLLVGDSGDQHVTFGPADRLGVRAGRYLQSVVPLHRDRGRPPVEYDCAEDKTNEKLNKLAIKVIKHWVTPLSQKASKSSHTV